MSQQYYIPDGQETYQKEGTYTSKFLKWRAFVDRNAILRSIMNANADAVTASWRTYGKNAKSIANVLDDMRGNGKEAFKMIMNNALKVAKIGGDYYAEIIYDDVKGIQGEVPVDLITLPSDHINQVVKNGRIKRYESNVDGTRFKTEEIFHLAYNPIGCQTHGNSVLEPMNNLLIHMDSLMESGSKIFEKYVKPMNLVYMKTDSATEMQKLVDDWKAAFKTTAADMFLPADIVEKVDRVGMPPHSTLDPAHWYKVLLNNLLMASRVPENVLGIGTQNSEESARMQMAGFRQMIRWDQKFLEENMRLQLFQQMYPDESDRIKFSYATEAQEETWKRQMDSMQVIAGLPLPDQLKSLLIIKIMIEMELIPNE